MYAMGFDQLVEPGEVIVIHEWLRDKADTNGEILKAPESMRPTRLVISDVVAPNFAVLDFLVNEVSVFKEVQGLIPAEVFVPNVPSNFTINWVCQRGQRISLHIKNITSKPARFLAVVFGATPDKVGGK